MYQYIRQHFCTSSFQLITDTIFEHSCLIYELYNDPILLYFHNFDVYYPSVSMFIVSEDSNFTIPGTIRS